MPHTIKWYKPNRIIKVNDKMQKTEYRLTARYGKDFDKDFKPYYSPAQMLKLGVFEGKYLNDCINEFPIEWYINAKKRLSLIANPKLNCFGIKSRLSLQEWRKRGWIPIKVDKYKDIDIRGWFQWYCRYYIGRRCPTDQKQISRWKKYIRHKAQVVKSIKELSPSKRPKTRNEIKTHRPRQRQSLLQWAYNPW